MTLDGKIALIGEMIETKIRKEKELEYYQQQLEELTKKMFFLQKDVLLNLCKVWCLVQQDNPVKMTCVKRGLINGLEPVSYVSRDHGWVATTSLLFEFSYNVTVCLKPWISIPVEWLSEVHHFREEPVQTLGLVEAPCRCSRCMKKRKLIGLGSLEAH